MKLVYEAKYLKIEIDSSKKLMVQTWTRFCSTEEFKDGQEKTVKFFRENNCKYFISDALKAGVRQKEDTDWAARVIIPQLAQNGMEVLNFVIPESYFAKLAIQNLDSENATNKDSAVKIKYYSTKKDALSNLA